MNRDFERRSNCGLNNFDSQRVHVDQVHNFINTQMFPSVRKYQALQMRDKLKDVAEHDEVLSSKPVRVVGGVSAIYFDSPVMIKLSEETRVTAHTSIPDQTGHVDVSSPVVNGAIEMDGRADQLLAPGQVPVDPTWTREKYRVSLTRSLGIQDITSAVSYGSTTTNLNASLSKPISSHVTAVVESLRPTAAPGAQAEERVKVLYGISF
jgi:hypothetical protein